MAALTQARSPLEVSLKNVGLPLAAQHVYPGGRACLDTATNQVKKAAAGNANLVSVGEFAEEQDNTGGLAPTVLVRFDSERFAHWYDNATGASAVVATDLFTTNCYWLDDHTVKRSSSGDSQAGRVMQLDTVKGVLVLLSPGAGGL
jgi:hypothetical protein